MAITSKQKKNLAYTVRSKKVAKEIVDSSNAPKLSAAAITAIAALTGASTAAQIVAALQAE